MPDTITIFDTTLRDGEQSPGCSMTISEKLKIAEALVELGVDVIEAGFPIASPDDFESVRAIARKFGDRTTICGLALDVHVLVLRQGEKATKLKLMQFKSSPGARVDNTFIHSSYGFRYLTIAVKDVNAAVARAEKAGAKPIAKCPVPLPVGFPSGLALTNYRDPDGNLVELVGRWQK